MEEDKERKKLCALNNVVKPERPDPGIVMGIPFSQSEKTATGNISTSSPYGPIINKNSIATSSEFSYTKAIKSIRIPSMQPLFNNKNIRLTKSKNKKKMNKIKKNKYTNPRN